MSNTAKLLQTATNHHKAGRYAEAEKAYQRLLQQDASAEAARLLGALYLQTGRADKAVETLEQAVRLASNPGPPNPETLTNLGVALRTVGRHREALDLYRQALAQRPDYRLALNNMGALLHEQGRLPEAIAIYADVLRLDPDLPTAHYNIANSMLMAGRGADAIARYEYALKLKPDYLDAMINLGMALGQAGKGDRSRGLLEKAYALFEKALAVDPNSAIALNNMGNILRQLGQAGQAVECFRRAQAARPDYVEAAINCGTSLRDLGRLEEAIDSCRLALRHRPDSANARINLGTFLQEQGKHAEAIAVFDEALARKPASIDARWNKALSLLALGQYEEGFALHEAGLGIKHMRGDYPSPDKRWAGENFAGKRLLLWCEQGLGDSLQFIRYAEQVKARAGVDGEVIVLCPRPLRRLFGHCPFIDRLPESVEADDFDLHVPLMSLPYIFATRLEKVPAAVPYLSVGDDTRATWRAKVPDGDNLRVGLVWAGNPRDNQINAHMIDKRRSMTLDLLLPLFDVSGVDFYNLQMGAAAEQGVESGMGARLIDCMGEVKDFEDTGGLVERLDLVISVDTSVVHLAGGLGRPVWVLSRFDACWRWLGNREDSPWYPTARLFGQTAPGEWQGVVERVRAALKKVAAKN